MLQKLVGIIFLVSAALLVACGGNAGGDGTPITIVAKEFKFEPATITVTPGQAVKLTLKNEGVIDHDLMIKAVGFKILVGPGKAETKMFVAPAAPGTYDIECNVAGHKDAGMIGTFVVK